MAKLTVEDKKKIIDLYKEGYGALTISRKINIGCARIREILRKYDLYGDEVIEV